MTNLIYGIILGMLFTAYMNHHTIESGEFTMGDKQYSCKVVEN